MEETLQILVCPTCGDFEGSINEWQSHFYEDGANNFYVCPKCKDGIDQSILENQNDDLNYI